MNTHRPLPEIFAKFAELEIPHESYEHSGRSGKIFILQRPTQEGEKIISEIYKVAKDNNVNLRLWTPNMMGTADVQTARLNIRTTNWVIKNECYYG